MYYINPTPNPSGAYAAPQSKPAPGLLALPDNLLQTFLEYNGFVLLTVEGSEITALTPNQEAWEAWRTSQPEPSELEPSEQEDTDAMLVDHEYRLTLLELGVTDNAV